MSPAREYHAARLALPVLGDELASEDSGEYRVAVLSAGLLQAVINTYGEGYEGFSIRFGLPAGIVAKTASGAWPAWALPYEEFTAIAGAVGVLWPCAAFEITAACDLLLSCVLNGDHVMATDVLTDPCTRELARALLRKAQDNLLSDELLVLLSRRAVALAGSGSPDAWVGLDILTTCRGGQS